MPSERDRVVAGPLRPRGPDRVEALFTEEVAAQEAIGLLTFHGFRRDDIGLQSARGAHLQRVRPRPRRRPRFSLRWRATAASTRDGATGVASPDEGCIVEVRTLRAEEARTVLERAGGILVVTGHSASDTEGHGRDGHGQDPAGRGRRDGA